MKIYDEVREFVTNIFYNGAVVKAWLGLFYETIEIVIIIIIAKGIECYS